MLESVLAIFIFEMLYSACTKKESPVAFQKLKTCNNARPLSLSLVPLTSDTPDLLSGSNLEQGGRVCTASVMQAVHVCVPKYSFVASLTKSMLTTFLSSCHSYITPVLSHIILCLLSVNCYLLGFLEKLEEAALPLDQAAIAPAKEEKQEDYQVLSIVYFKLSQLLTASYLVNLVDQL